MVVVRKFYSPIFLTLLLLLLTSLFYSNNASAAVAPRADGVFREGGVITFGNNHAGLFKDANQFYEAPGLGNGVVISTQENFIDTYSTLWWRHVSSMTNSKRDSILATAAALEADSELAYTLFNPLASISNPGTYISVDEITHIRCDGVVEYSYEWNSEWIWGKASPNNSSGTPTNFDISNASYLPEHGNLGYNDPWFEFGPRVQRGGAAVANPFNWTKLSVDTSPSATTYSENKTIDSPHPYGNNQVYGYFVKKPGATQIRVRFSYINTLSGDYVTTSSGNSWSGNYSNVWSNWMSGDTINFSLTTNASGTANGFVVDRFEYRN